MSRTDWRRISACGLLACSWACGDGRNPPAPIGGLGDTDSPTMTATGTATGTATDDSATGATMTAGVDTSGGPGPLNCGDVVCTGFGHCEIGEDGLPYCACDPGYVVDESGEVCIVDESCVQLRFLEDRCRQVVNGAPAVSLFFAVDFCAGTAVLPAKIDELGLTFTVLENGNDVEDNVESFATVIPKPVESYVDLVIDVSESITGSQDLAALVEQLRALVTSLAPEPGASDVYVSIHVFGRESAEYVPFTRDLGAVDAALAAIVADPAAVVLQAGGGDGTDLFDGLELGINRTQRIRDLRDGVTWGGVLSTGTVVVVTDGNDSSGGTLDQGLVDRTTNNVISIGISADVDDQVLQAIGRDGSFLAPSPEDWPAAFAEITRRVQEYPQRSYLLAYCSSTTEGSPNVEISIDGATEVAKTAVCQFDADVFGSGSVFTCDASYFAGECGPDTCGGLTACGACDDDECCDGFGCRAPQIAGGSPGLECDGQNDLCAQEGLICYESGTCGPATPLEADCGEGCEPGASYCRDEMDEPEVCIPALAMGQACETPEQCPELNCQRQNPDNAFQVPTCRPEALLHDPCGSDDAVCEAGGYCQSTCLPRKRSFESCGGAKECRTAQCNNYEGAGNLCDGLGACFWSWDEKVPA